MCLRTGFLDNLLANGSHFSLHLFMTTASEQLDESKVNKKQQKKCFKIRTAFARSPCLYEVAIIITIAEFNCPATENKQARKTDETA